ncbi:amino acid/amide ABC transporter substrate-binding protein (HAAT family) [Rhodopseudomonas thermotolerans]|jgi:ABC-type branched-subunit amino acid transport system substrate-binding protein|uniref:Amino acid/amide ABC transporter substrate-binding protein (HAAT family) n=2 Tax=Rhodopseudomonas TaxID=1073 RepID=A0A336JN78_9BRAD|nr:MULTISPECIES: ABC transporter substrate-binding protein [Rhodopseudomonas]RED37723.1 amino acid/amide ABC transporter substrate-binding protein (HAAT family) [Rhodopseudomonas pentothenatexigens]REG04457.1 amino acid/amide ABC transporter substrate-binding protein (HAAT family) [Rhodopseudomonas thermotolerans]SSW90223.1 amino acid/amide ABC transporter substrate-binding protein (HAAT family) [Rhodopseudomonas pentothenatexigens]
MSALSRSIATLATVALLTASSGQAMAQKKYGPGASDTEVKIGNIVPYSGPASAYGSVGRAQEAYFKMINDKGGINGRKIVYISYDDAYSPPKAVEQTRKLVESDEVLFMFSPLGTPSNTAIQKYLNAKKVPHLFLASGATKWNDPKHFPWTMGWLPSYQSEGRIYAKYILKEKPDAKIAVLYQGDDFGKDYLKGLKDGLGAKASQVVIEDSYELTEPTVDSHIVKIKAAEPDVLVIFATPKFAAQTIKKVAELAWKPMMIVPNVSASTGSVMKPAGFANAQGIVSAAYAKDATDKQWENDPGMKAYYEFMAKYAPDASRADSSFTTGYNIAETVAVLIKQCGDDLSRENVMKQAANLKGVQLGGLLPGITLNTSATDFAPIEQLQMMRFEGENWKLFGDVIEGEVHSPNGG